MATAATRRQEIARDVSLDPMDLMRELAVDARLIDEAAGRLQQLIEQYEGARDGELGIKLRWEAEVDEATLGVEAEMLSRAENPDWKVPAGLKTRGHKMIEAEGRTVAKQLQPELYAEYCQLTTTINAFQKWLNAKERSLSARQSILSSQRSFA